MVSVLQSSATLIITAFKYLVYSSQTCNRSVCLCVLEDHFIIFFKDQCFHWLDYLYLIWHPFAGTKVTKISKMFGKCEKQSKGNLILRFFLPALVGQDKQGFSISSPLIYGVQSFSFLCISSIWKSSFAFQFCFLFSLCILKKKPLTFLY